MKLHRSMSAGNKRALLLSLIVTVVLSLLPISSHATIDWNDDFEYADQTAFEAVWSSSCVGNSGIISPSIDRAFTGSMSLKETFNDGANSCFIDRYLPANSDTLWIRYYVYINNMTWVTVPTKSTFHGQNGAYPSFWWGFNGTNGASDNPQIIITPQNITLANGSVTTINIFGGTVPQNQWVCIEERITMSSPGGADGIIQEWNNGTQTMNITNQPMRPLVADLNNLTSPTAQFQFVRLYTQHGFGTIYYDDYAVSRDARIGCGNMPTSDTTPPAAPQGLFIR